MTELADILGPEGAAGDPEEISRVANQLQQISDTAGSIRSRIGALDGAQWTGEAADAYREKQNTEIPGEMSKIADSFGIAAQALSTYAGNLAGILDQAATLIGRANDANDALDNTRQYEWSAGRTFADARAAHAAATDPVSKANAEATLTSAAQSYHSAVRDREEAEADVNRIANDAAGLRQDLDNCAGTCANGLNAASAAGIRNSLFSWADRHIVDGVVGQVVGDVVDTVGNFAAKSFDLLRADVAFELDPSLQHLDALAHAYSDWVDAAKPIIEAVAIAAMVVAAAVIVFCQPETIAAIVPAMSAIGDATAALSTGLDATKTVSDTYLLARHQASAETVFGDVVDTGLDVGLSKLDPGGVKDSQIDDLNSSLGDWHGVGLAPRSFVTTQIQGVERTELHSVVFEAGSELVTHGADALVPVVTPYLESGIRGLLGNPAFSPTLLLAGPFTALTQGPGASMRFQVAGSAVLAGAMA